MAEETTGTETADPPVSVVNADGTFTENWHDKYGEENKPHLSRYKTFDDLVNSTVATKKKFGKDPNSLVEIPTEHSSDEVKAAFKKARGAPDSIDAYEYTLSDEMAVKLGPLRDDLMTKAKEHAHKQGWNPQEFKANLDLYHDIMSGDIDAFGEQTTKQAAEAAEKAKVELMKQPGWQTEVEYKDKVQNAQYVMEKYGLVDGVAELNLQNSPKMIKGLNNVYDATDEDKAKGLKASSGTTTANIKTQIAEIRTRMDKIIKENPSNFKGNVEFKDLMKRKSELYKQMPK